MHPAFVRAAKSVRSRLGLNALFAGAHETKAPLEHGIEVVDGQGNVTVAQYVATLDKALDCNRGDTLVYLHADGNPILGESYKLDTLIADNGANQRWVLLKD